MVVGAFAGVAGLLHGGTDVHGKLLRPAVRQVRQRLLRGLPVDEVMFAVPVGDFLDPGHEQRGLARRDPRAVAGGVRDVHLVAQVVALAVDAGALDDVVDRIESADGVDEAVGGGVVGVGHHVAHQRVHGVVARADDAAADGVLPVDGDDLVEVVAEGLQGGDDERGLDGRRRVLLFVAAGRCGQAAVGSVDDAEVDGQVDAVKVGEVVDGVVEDLLRVGPLHLLRRVPPVDGFDDGRRRLGGGGVAAVADRAAGQQRGDRHAGQDESGDLPRRPRSCSHHRLLGAGPGAASHRAGAFGPRKDARSASGGRASTFLFP